MISATIKWQSTISWSKIVYGTASRYTRRKERKRDFTGHWNFHFFNSVLDIMFEKNVDGRCVIPSSRIENTAEDIVIRGLKGMWQTATKRNRNMTTTWETENPEQRNGSSEYENSRLWLHSLTKPRSLVSVYGFVASRCTIVICERREKKSGLSSYWADGLVQSVGARAGLAWVWLSYWLEAHIFLHSRCLQYTEL